MANVDLSTSRETESRPRRSVCDVVTLVEDIAVPIGYPFIMPAGDKATIVHVEPGTGDIVIQLHTAYAELAHRRGILCVSAAEAEIDLA
jgi:hypothetical protein